MSSLKAKLQDKLNTQPAHIMVTARAGTGKTTTIVEGTKLLFNQIPSIEPSEQQQAIWDEVIKSVDSIGASPGQHGLKIGFCAFNTTIKDELERRIPRGCTAKTMHGLGNGAIFKKFGRTQMKKEWKLRNIVSDITGKQCADLWKKSPELLNGACELADKCRLNLEYHELEEMVDIYDINLGNYRPDVFDMMSEIIDRCRDIPKYGIDFTDMLWAPIDLSLDIPTYDLLFVDEAQDLFQVCLRVGS